MKTTKKEPTNLDAAFEADALVVKLVAHAKLEAEKNALTGMEVYPFALGYVASRLTSVLSRSEKERTELESFLSYVR